MSSRTAVLAAGVAVLLGAGACRQLLGDNDWGFASDAGAFDGGTESATSGSGGDSGTAASGSVSGSGTSNSSGGSGSGSAAGSSGVVSSGSGSGSASGASGGSGNDAGTCAPVTVMPATGGPACPMGTSACYPQDVTSFSPTWVPPLGHNLGACTASQIADYSNQCLGSVQSATCSSWPTANMGCYGCLVTPHTQSQWGAVVEYGTSFHIRWVNVGGCIALAESCNLACASAVEAELQCKNTACDPSSTGVCSVTDQNSYQSYKACTTEPMGSCGCTAYYQSTSCLGSMAQKPAEHPALTTCYGGSLTAGFQQVYQAVATFMCGP
jgi:hypothetical protein